MSAVQETSGFRTNLAQLQSESLTLISLFSGAIGFAWVCWVVWPLTGGRAPVSAWVGAVLFVLSGLISQVPKERHLHLLSHLLVWCVTGAVACALLTFRLPGLAYLFILPIIFASAILSQREIFIVAGAVSLLTLIIGEFSKTEALLSTDMVLPVATMMLIAIACWLTARNLYTALAWVWSGYERARQNEQVARERQAELRRVLKALDEANYRLERSNYMLTLARDQADEARRLKQQFVQTISHELRTPLNLIVGFTELMVQSPEHYGAPPPPTYVRDLSIVHRNACHLQSLVNDVLDLARIEAAQMSFIPERADTKALVMDAVNTARNLVEARGLVLRTEVEHGLPALWVDPIRIRQVLFNLLNNAARFTERGSITISVRRQGEDVVFAVADTGSGIASEDIPRLFEEFQQLDGSTRRQHGGAGLGLAISRRFVEMHGGRIWAESQLGQGSTFYFSLPVASTDSAVVSGRASTSVNVPKLTSRWGQQGVVLVVTRSPSAATLLTRYLRGCRTMIYNDLKQAEAAAKRLMPQTVIIDKTCEKLTAGKLEELAQAWGLQHTPFIACPLPGEEPLRQHLTVDGYLVKPVSRGDLWDVLRQFGEGVDKILVIDDDRDFVRMMGRMMDSPVRRYQVIGAYNGKEGLALMHHRRPDLVLVDLELPDMDGFEVVQSMRSSSNGEQVPIVVISARDGTNTLGTLPGGMSIAKAEGLIPSEVIRWLQNVLDMAMLD
jgi:signal transduction histidine kinase/DNA-binding response OmpR family regulator